MRIAEALPRNVRIENAGLLNVLIVDDEQAIREACQEIVRSLGFNVWTARTAEQAYAVVEEQNMDIVLLDLKLPGASGLEALRKLHGMRSEMSVIVMTGYATVQSAVDAMKNGACEYLTKPFGCEELSTVLAQAANLLHKKAEARVLQDRAKSKQGFGGIIGQSAEMTRLYRIIAKASQSTHPVLILGESGTGKELVARSIHFSGILKDKPFIPVDCGSLVPTLIESELFGHVKGAFTGANNSKDGLLAVAEGGTVFLDEIGELPIFLQAKLLRAIQEKEIRPVGSTRSVPINVRILAATNRDLEEAVQNGTFRRDLYFRLNVLVLRIPPLRERREDLPMLIGCFLERLNKNKGKTKEFSEESIKALLAYEWPGNVRELENCVERAWTMSSGPVIQTAELPPALTSNQMDGFGSISRAMPIAELEKQAILSTLQQVNGDKLEAARKLGIGKTTLYRKLKEYASHA
jgi:DNA-binding NtrC family response regulator